MEAEVGKSETFSMQEMDLTGRSSVGYPTRHRKNAGASWSAP